MIKIETPKISEILLEEFMKPLHLSAYKLAKEIRVPVSRIQDILHDRRSISAETSIRLGRYFHISEKYFLKLQNDIDLREAREKINKEKKNIRKIKSGEKEDINKMPVFNQDESW